MIDRTTVWTRLSQFPFSICASFQIIPNTSVCSVCAFRLGGSCGGSMALAVSSTKLTCLATCMASYSRKIICIGWTQSAVVIAAALLNTTSSVWMPAPTLIVGGTRNTGERTAHTKLAANAKWAPVFATACKI